MADATAVKEVLPPHLDSKSEPPPLFDGTTRLYINDQCPFVQRVWIVRNYKGLYDEIKLVPINLADRPAWYKEKVYPENKVPALEHNGKIIGESLDLVKYIDANFKGPSLLPEDPEKKKVAEELIDYSETFLKSFFASIKTGDPEKQAGQELNYLETALQKYDDGPFFLGQFSQVDAVYAPFIERLHIFSKEVLNHDITSERPKLASFIEEINKLDAYKPTKVDPSKLIPAYKARFMGQS